MCVVYSLKVECDDSEKETHLQAGRVFLFCMGCWVRNGRFLRDSPSSGMLAIRIPDGSDFSFATAAAPRRLKRFF